MSAGSAGRQASIDVLRAAAIGLMVLIHFVENLSGRYGRVDGTLGGVGGVWWLPTGVAAATFSFLSGVSYRLWVTTEVRRGRSDGAIAKTTVRRGLFLIGLGFAFNVLVWLPEDVFNWDILTLVGCGLLALEAARRMPSAAVILAAALAIAVAPAMRVVAGYSDFWVTGGFDYDFSLSDVMLGWLVTGYFPIFPWLAYPLVGFALGPDILSKAWRPVLIGGGLVAASAAMLLGWSALPSVLTGGESKAWTMFPASTPYVLGSLGGVIVALAFLHRTIDTDVSMPRPLVAWTTPLSRHSLSMYLLHHVVHLWPLWIFGLATTGEPTSLWQVAMPVAVAVSLSGIFLLAAVVLCREADRRQLPTAESLMRWVCD